MGGLYSDKATCSLKRRRKYGRGDMAVSCVLVACLATLAPPILAAELPKGLELAEAISTRAVESMKNDMVSIRRSIIGMVKMCGASGLFRCLMLEDASPILLSLNSYNSKP